MFKKLLLLSLLSLGMSSLGAIGCGDTTVPDFVSANFRGKFLINSDPSANPILSEPNPAAPVPTLEVSCLGQNGRSDRIDYVTVTCSKNNQSRLFSCLGQGIANVKVDGNGKIDALTDAPPCAKKSYLCNPGGIEDGVCMQVAP